MVTLTVESCNRKTIPAVAHATYTVSEERVKGHYSLPDRVNVTYTCNKGYSLQNNESSSVIGCQYVTTQRDEMGDDVLAEARWTSTEGIVCK